MDSGNSRLGPFEKLKHKLARADRKQDGRSRSEDGREGREADIGGSVEEVDPPPIPHDGKPRSTDTSAIPGHVQEDLSSKHNEPGAADENRFNRWKSTLSATAKLILRGVNESADAFPPLKSVAGGLCFILENCERTKANSQAIESLALRVEALSTSLCTPVSEHDAKEEARRRKLTRKLEEILRELEPLAEQGRIEGFFTNVKNADKLGGLVGDIHDAVMDYQTSLQQDIYNKGCKLIGDVDRIFLNGMHHISDAGHRSGNRQGCLWGTREDVLLQLERWLKDNQDQRVFWLNGLAGTGKSTIAQTFADICFADGNLGASFFCSRESNDRGNLQNIIPTLAFQLAYRYPPFREELLELMRANPDIGRESLSSQMEKLVADPLKATQIQTLIIIDALDECRDQEPESAILFVLSKHLDQIPNVKFFITGRPEAQIRSGFRLPSLEPITKVFKLHEIDRSLVDRDIRLFFKTRLADVPRNRSDIDLTKDWPSSSEIDILCEKAGGFFIYASTVVKFVASKKRQPTKRLDLIISLTQSTAHEGRSGLDLLYTRVLESAVDDNNADDEEDADDEEFCSSIRTVVGAVLLAFDPLSVKTLSDLLKMSDISTTLRSLHSILLVPTNKADPVRVFHKSFPDFLTDPGRCTDKRFFVDPAVHHKEILLSCLNMIKEKSKKNICELDDRAFLGDVKDLPTRKTAHIGDGLEYACRFWTNHLASVPGTGPDVEEVYRAIDGFFTTCLPFWIEVLSLTRNLDTGVHAINEIRQWCASAGVSCEWANDSQRLLLEHFDAIRDSPSQIYHYALPLSPSLSWLHECYSKELSREVRMIKGLPDGWGGCSRTVTFDKIPRALSYWNDTVAVGSVSGDIIILDAITGSRTSILSGHTGVVESLTFSPDGMSVVSGSGDETVKLWDMQTGGVVKTFYGHTHTIYSVSVSPDCTTIASGSLDETIRLWDVWTGECRHVIKQDTWTECIDFSPSDPRRFISASKDGTVQQWDIDGRQIGPTYHGNQVAFSSDGTHFVSCSWWQAEIRKSNSGEIMAKCVPPDDLLDYCYFSPDSRLLAGAHHSSVYVWDITSPDACLIETFVGHTEPITSLAFSSPSSLVSASHDGSIKFWQIGASSTDPAATNDPESTPSTSAPIRSVSLQAKDGIAISSDSGGVVRIWDISMGFCKASFQTPATNFIDGDAQLIDGGLIFVWLGSNKFWTWDSKKDKILWAVDTGHSWKSSIRISGDGSKVFCLCGGNVEVWSVWTGEIVSKVKLKGTEEFPTSLYLDPLRADNSRIWVLSNGRLVQGWDFGIPGSSPVLLSNAYPESPRLDFHEKGSIGPSIVKDAVTGKEVFRLFGRYAKPVRVQWDGRYLVAGYKSGEVLILDFDRVFHQ